MVTEHYALLYRFALSLTRQGADALDLTQQTLVIWGTKGRQLRDRSKLKTWLCTTLYREYLATRRRAKRFPHFELSVVEDELPSIGPDAMEKMDAATVMETLMTLEEVHRVPLMLFYVQDRSYQEIAGILEVPIGTVMSRLARGKEQLRKRLTVSSAKAS